MARKEVLVESSGEPPAREASSRGAPGIFTAVCLMMTALALLPLWTTRLLPMQDYPQHLLVAHIAATYQQGGVDWQEIYRVDLGFRPYMLWYLVMKPLAGAFGVEAAGRLLFSLYILLVSLLVFTARRLTPGGHLPWGALLLYPFAFNQVFFLGFANYTISLPLIFLALLDLERLAAGKAAAVMTRHGLYLVLLFLIHPYSLLVYCVLACTVTLAGSPTREEALRSLAPAAAIGALMLGWYLSRYEPATAATTEWPLTWWRIEESLAYYLLQFTGMRWRPGPHWPTVILWILAALPLLLPWHRRRRGDRLWRKLSALYLVSLAAFLALPIWMGNYSYFNLRMAPVSYFALALLLCRLPVRTGYGVLLGCAAAALVLDSTQTQQAVAREAETVLAVAGSITKNSLVLPLIFQADSKELEPAVFGEIHSHEVDYCQLGSGGGNPTLFRNTMMPVQYQRGLRLPRPPLPELFTWAEHGVYYDYIVTRGAPGSFPRLVAPHCRLVVSSPPWSVFRNNSVRKPLPREAQRPM